MPDVTASYDVIVIGGGPAGSTIGALLARSGHSVALFERERFPRDHVGESLLPFCYHLFEDLGVLDEMKRYFVRKPGVRFINADGTASTTWCFNHVIRDETHLSFQVNRADFDNMLLKNAAHHGVEVHEATPVRDVDITTHQDSATITFENEKGVRRRGLARFLIDASGRDAVLGSKHGWRKTREELDRTALWCHWEGVTLAGGLEEGLSVIVYMGQEKKGWLWVFPLDRERITAGFVAQNSYIREEHRRLQELGSSDWQYDLLIQELEASDFVRGLLVGGRRAMPVQVNGNYSYEVKNHFGSNYCMVGDARGFIDPIFSSGIFLSMKSAYLVAPPVHKLLTTSVRASGDLAEAYRHITGAYDFVHRMIRLFYNPHAITWADVGADGQIHKRAESAMAAGHFMLSGDFFENYAKYDEFFRLLEAPRQFQRYKELIIDRIGGGEPTCGQSHDVVFGGMTARRSPHDRTNG